MNALHPVIHDSLRHGINTVAQMQKAIMSEETKPHNPPAFPETFSEGMTLLDYFAGKAIGLFSLTDAEVRDMERGTAKPKHALAAAFCYDLAAAMLKEREKHL